MADHRRRLGRFADLRRRMASPRLWCLIGVLGLLPLASIRAGQITEFALEARGDGYHLKARGLIEAPRDAVWQVLTDYDALSGVSPRIIESELVAVSPEGIFRVRTLNRLCFLFLCRDLRHLQLIRELGYGDFESHSVGAQSDLSRGYARWRLHERGAQTELDILFDFAMDTYAWVPPLVTRVVARSALEEDARVMIEGIERAVRRRKVGTDAN